jgi:chemotaxis protein histidine kinase CheA
MFDPGEMAPEDLEILMPIFRASGEQRIAELRHTLDTLGRVPDDPEALTLLHRAAHSLKGASLQLGLVRIGTLARAMEAAASASQTCPGGMPADALPLLALCADWLECQLHGAEVLDGVPDAAEGLQSALESLTSRLILEREARGGAA